MKLESTSTRLKRIMADRNLRQVDILNIAKPYCEKFGVKLGKNDLSQYVSGKVEPRQEKLTILGLALDVNEAWLMGYDVSIARESPSNMQPPSVTTLPKDSTLIDYSKYKRIPILGRIPAGMPLLAEENIEGYTLTDLNGGAEYFALRVTGDSMNAIGIMEGHLLHVRKQPEVENGEIAVVMVGDDDATVKRFYSTGTTVTLMPQSTNPIHQPQIYDIKQTRIEVLGKVVKVEFMV